MELSPPLSPSENPRRLSCTTQNLQALEAQQQTLQRPPPTARRRDTEISWSQDSSTTFIKSPSTIFTRDFSRRGTSLSNASFPPKLERTPTYNIADEALRGYPKLAAELGTTENYAIYRRFDALNARNLLYHQAKLTYLEHELHELELEHEKEEQLHCKIDHLFCDEKHPHGSPGRALRHKYEQIGTALDRYNGLLLQQSQLHELPKADTTFVKSIWSAIDFLEHPEDTAYAIDDETGKAVQSDLVTLNRAFRQQDPFTRFFTGPFIEWFHGLYKRFRKPDGDLGEYVYSDKKVGTFMRAFVMVVASALPTCSIVALYFIQSAVYRLAFIVIFSGIFACALTVFTEARSIDVFTASVALASVQVVFVGTAFGNGGNLSD
ncbi:hypothetical protein AC579_2892 [Pseudocercospora musae]|uniref:DUF6594 domain-containing protein n=1 Tax=Pseudocercospora musae TaxID=113226 RepID=A0A139ITY9_9PEZI|nr:hypothetical protein AC579_2892 [Pseudocercospora musae]